MNWSNFKIKALRQPILAGVSTGPGLSYIDFISNIIRLYTIYTGKKIKFIP